jgi:uracil permease
MARRIIQVEEKVGLLEGFPLSLQHLFAMFGASVLVPTLFGIDPAVVLLMNGIGTLIYLFLCKGKAPAFLGSSFAFISPVFVVLGADKSFWGANYSYALGGFIAAGCVFITVALIIGYFGTEWLKIVLPPAAMGPIVALIGLELGTVAASMAGIIPDAQGVYDSKAVIVSMVTLAVAVFGSVMLRGFLAVIPILIAIVVGYCVALPMGIVNYEPVAKAGILAIPQFYTPKFNINAVIVILPAALVVISEHIGHLILTGNIVERDLTKDPGLHRSLMGDGISTVISGFTGSVLLQRMEKYGSHGYHTRLLRMGNRRSSRDFNNPCFYRKTLRAHPVNNCSCYGGNKPSSFRGNRSLRYQDAGGRESRLQQVIESYPYFCCIYCWYKRSLSEDRPCTA